MIVSKMFKSRRKILICLFFIFLVFPIVFSDPINALSKEQELQSEISNHGYNVTYIERGEGKWDFNNYWNYVVYVLDIDSIPQEGNLNLLLGSDITEELNPIVEEYYPDSEMWITILHNNGGNVGIVCIDSIPELNYGGCSEYRDLRSIFPDKYFSNQSSTPSNTSDSEETDQEPTLEILSPTQNQIIKKDSLEIQFKIEGDKLEYCEFELYSIEQSKEEKEFDEVFDSTKSLYTRLLNDFENGNYFLNLTCVGDNSQEVSKKVNFKIDMPNNSNDIEEIKEVERIEAPKDIETETIKNVVENSTQEEAQSECANGCYYDDRCIPFGTRIKGKNEKIYCDISNTLKNQKEEGASCQNDFECLSGECNDEECFSLQKNLEETGRAIEEVESKVDENTNTLKRIIDFLKSLFGVE